MSKQQETWKESLARVRGELVESKNETVEETVEETQTEEDSLIEEIGLNYLMTWMMLRNQNQVKLQ